KLYDNLNIGENFTRGDLVTVIYNSLDVNMLVKSFNTSEIEYEIKEGETLRVRLTQGNHEIYKSRGIIMANEWTWLDVPISDLESDEVIIDNIVYKVGNTDAKNYIGIEVDFFAEKNKITDEFMLKAIKATKKNTKTTIDSRDITEITQNEISYSKKDKIVKLRIDEQPKVVKNGMLLKVYQIENLKPKNGTMTVIDNNGDSRVDIISIEEYVNVKVERIQNDTIFLYNGYKFGKNAFIKIDKNDNDRKYIIENKKGEALEISDIKADSIISIISDEEKTRMKLKVSDEIVEGDITSIFKDKATINDVEYYLDEEVQSLVMVGMSTVAYIDVNGNIAAIKELETDEKFGVIAGVSKNTGLIGDTDVRMIVGGKVEEKIEKNEQNKEDKNEIKSLLCKNEDVLYLTLASKVKLNTKRIDSSDLETELGKLGNKTGVPVTYTCGSDGKIRTIKTLTLSGGQVNAKVPYNVKDKTFGVVGKTMDPFAINLETKVVCLPEDDGRGLNVSDKDYMTPVVLDNKAATSTYNAQGYEYNDDTKKVKYIVVTTPMDSTNIPPINIDSSSIGIVSDAANAIDEDGDEFYKISILRDGEVKEYLTIDIIDKNREIKDLTVGDLIYFNKNSEEKLENVQIIYSFVNDGVKVFNDGNGSAKQQACGYVLSTEFDEIDRQSNSLITKAILNGTNSDISVSIPQRNSPQIFIYNTKGTNKTVEMGSLKELSPFEGKDGDMLYVIMPYDKVKACVIIR
ncbi:MAG: hypothetical protein RSA27_05515, partial [Oscillospiraceae bacterium]